MKKCIGIVLIALILASVLSCGLAENTRDVKTQVAIIGAGGAGMAAAIQAYDEDLQVILVEKLSFVGGTTIMASTAYNAGGMKL